MTEPGEVTTADPGLEVEPEVIEDLDVTGDDADAIVGGLNVDGKTCSSPPAPTPVPIPYPL